MRGLLGAAGGWGTAEIFCLHVCKLRKCAGFANGETGMRNHEWTRMDTNNHAQNAYNAESVRRLGGSRVQIPQDEHASTNFFNFYFHQRERDERRGAKRREAFFSGAEFLRKQGV
jgi:hypothetical protein